MSIKGKSYAIQYYCYDTANNVGKTGDDGNHTLRLVRDGVEVTPSGAISEVDSTNLEGIYSITLTGEENAGDFMTFGGNSATASIIILPQFWTNDDVNARVQCVQTQIIEMINALGVAIKAGAIKDTSYDQSTAFPLKSDDSGASQIARVGADGDTLETLSDQIDAVLTDTGTTLENHLTDIKGTGFAKDTDSLPQCLTATGFSTHSAADVLSVDPSTAVVGAAPATLKAYIQGIWNSLYKKQTVVANLQTWYETDNATTMETATLSDDDTTALRDP